MKAPTERIYQGALSALRRAQAAAIVTVVDAPSAAPREPGTKMLVFADGETIGTVGGGAPESWVVDRALEAIASGRSRLMRLPVDEDDPDLCGRDVAFFVDVILPQPTLFVVGAGHIGQAVAEIGAWLGYRVAVLDERESMVSVERFPDADLLLSGSIVEKLQEISLPQRLYVLILTPHDSRDEEILAELSRLPVDYLGLLGGRRRTAATFDRARALGVPDRFLAHIHTPIGLDIEAETPREIALSILAEVTAVRRGLS